jgi:AraC-like DNA-binding protein
MLRRWRVRYSYPISIVELVVQLEPIFGVAALSRLLDIPMSVMYRWRANYRGSFAPLDPSDHVQMLKILHAHCDESGFRVAAYAYTTSNAARASLHTLPCDLPTQALLDKSPQEAPRDPPELWKPTVVVGVHAQQGEAVLSDRSGSRRISNLARRYVFDAQKERPACRVHKRMQSVRQTLDTQYFLDLDCRTLAEMARMSLHHFVRVFGDIFGISPHQYLCRVRVQAAKRLLLVSSEPIEVIAVGVGLRTSASLNHAFKRIEGTTLSKYCKTLKKGSIGRQLPNSRSIATVNAQSHTIHFVSCSPI